MYVTGINPTSVKTSTEGPEFKLGTLGAVVNQNTIYTAPMGDTGSTAGSAVGPKIYMYVQADAGGITGDGYVVVVNPATFVADMIDTTNSAPGAGAGFHVGVGRAAVAASGYGWVQVYGPGVVRVAASAALGTLLNSTGTAGQIDDDATAGAEIVDGIVLTTANGGSAGTAAGVMNWPKVGRTL